MDVELIEGRLCEKGYLKERYDENKKDLVRTFTRKGIEEVRKMLKEPEWRKIAIILMKANGWSDAEIKRFFELW